MPSVPEASGISDSSYGARLARHHNELLQLCNQLEQLADDLPESVSLLACLDVANRMCRIIRQAHTFEEDTMFPALRASTQDDTKLHGTLCRLQFEHWEDESLAEDLCECLRDYSVNPDPAIADKLAYMLRCFFDGVRRHIAFEQEYLVPQVGRLDLRNN